MTPDTPPVAVPAAPCSPEAVLHRLRRMLQAMPIVQTLGLEVCAASDTDVVVELPMQPALCFRPGQLQATTPATA